MADEFYGEDDKESSKIKLGDKEYEQEELSKLVGLAETAREFEQKWDRKIEDFYPDYTRKSQRLSELEKKEQEWKQRQEEEEKKQLEKKAAEGTLSPEEQKRAAVEQARNLGIITEDIFSKRVNEEVARAMAGRQLIDDTEKSIREANKKYGISTDVNAVLKHMDSEGFKKPDKAIKDMFESQIDKWKEQELRKIKPKGMETEKSDNTGGSKVPEKTKVTRDNLQEAIRASLMRNRNV